MASGSRDNRICLWDTATGACVNVLVTIQIRSIRSIRYSNLFASIGGTRELGATSGVSSEWQIPIELVQKLTIILRLISFVAFLIDDDG